MGRPEFAPKLTHFKTWVGGCLLSPRFLIFPSQGCSWEECLWQELITTPSQNPAAIIPGHLRFHISRLHLFKVRNFFFPRQKLCLFSLPPSLSHSSNTSPTNTFHWPEETGPMSSALEAEYIRLIMSIFTKGREGGVQCLSGGAKLSGFMWSQDNARQGAVKAGTQMLQHKGFRTITRIKLYLPKRALTRGRMKAGEQQGQLWLGDLAGTRGAGPQICQEFCWRQ